ncbi:MAG: DUF2207 domain-containing protein [Christensenellaceae bacterium]|jgi:uncharacterized membrane protein YgcG|nr:DUF2207 domain-containing protein [Christensenellaceae bacterium]
MKIKKVLSFFVCALLVIIPSVFLSGCDAVQEVDKTYQIKNYETVINVSEKNILNITETIEIRYPDLGQEKHGIYRYLPLYNNVYIDGERKQLKTAITDISVRDLSGRNYQYDVWTENGNKVIQIGSEYVDVSGTTEIYVLRYRYDLGEDAFEDKDLFYFNVIAANWSSSIEYAEWTINFPKAIDREKVLGYYGAAGSDEVFDNLTFSNGDKTIRGQTTEPLPAFSGITIKADLPEGYFVGATVFKDWSFLMFLIPLVLLGAIFALWFAFGRDKKPTEVVEFYAPENLNPIELAFAYYGKITNTQIMSLLIYLANKGYIKVEAVGETYKIVKVKPYDGGNKNEEIFFKGLFKGKRTEVMFDELAENNFFESVQKILLDVNNPLNKTKVYTKQSIAATGGAYFLAVLAFLAILFVPMAIFEGVYLFPLVLIPYIIISAVARAIFKVVGDGKGVVIKVLCAVILGAFIVFAAAFVMPTIAISFTQTMMVYFVLGFLASVCAMVLASFVLKRTDKNTQLYGKIKGFRHFLQNVEVKKLEALVESDPQYFYNILPYTYVLGLSRKWIKRFESVAIVPPDWYYDGRGISLFDLIIFNSFFNSFSGLSTRVSVAGIANITSSGIGKAVSSGFRGGFSGGGFGGGGGGSW